MSEYEAWQQHLRALLTWTWEKEKDVMTFPILLGKENMDSYI